MPKCQIEGERRQTERFFCLLYNFFVENIKEQTTLAYEELLRVIKKVVIIDEETYVNVPERFFYFVAHLCIRLEMLSPSESLKDLKWLDSQSLSNSFAYFILFVDYRFGNHQITFMSLSESSGTLFNKVR
jgi:hypothetical protein